MPLKPANPAASSLETKRPKLVRKPSEIAPLSNTEACTVVRSASIRAAACVFPVKILSPSLIAAAVGNSAALMPIKASGRTTRQEILKNWPLHIGSHLVAEAHSTSPTEYPRRFAAHPPGRSAERKSLSPSAHTAPSVDSRTDHGRPCCQIFPTIHRHKGRVGVR